MAGSDVYLGAVDGLEQEIAVIAAVLNHRHIFIGGKKHLFPQCAIARKDIVLLLHELRVQFGGLVGVGRLLCYEFRDLRIGARGFARVATGRRARRKTQGQYRHHKQGRNLRKLHGHSSVLSKHVLLFIGGQGELFCRYIQAVAIADGIDGAGPDALSAPNAFGMIGCADHIDVHLTNL